MPKQLFNDEGGRGRGRGRGRGNGFRGGRGRGYSRGGRGRGGFGSSFRDDELDFNIQLYADSPNPSRGQANGYGTPRGRGRGRGQGSGNPRGTAGSRGRGRAFGIGASPQTTRSKVGANSTLSDLLFSSRPLLRPVIFVRSTQSRYLFKEEEDILKPIVEEIGDDDASHVPTADHINRIFNGLPNPFEGSGSGFGSSSSSSSSSDEDEEEEELEEIDFNDMQKLFEPATTSPKQKRKVKVTGPYNTGSTAAGVSSPGPTEITERIKDIQITQRVKPIQSPIPSRELNTTMQALEFTPPPPPPLFVVDTDPGLVPPPLEVPRPEISSDEEIIVYVAPHPRHGPRASSTLPITPKKNDAFLTGPLPEVDTSKFKPYTPPATLSLAALSINDLSNSPSLREADMKEPKSTLQQPLTAPIPTIESLKFEFTSFKASSSGTSEIASPRRKLPSIMSPRMAKKQTAWERKKAKREAKKFGTSGSGGKRSGRTKKGHVLGLGHMAAFGAIMSEAMMRGEEVEDVLKDERWEERRRGDSDLDWGTEDEDERYNVDLNGKEGLSEKARGKQRANEEDEDGKDYHGMDIDPELEMDVVAMKRFVGGFIGGEAGTFVTMDDIEVEQKLREEDEEGEAGPERSSDSSSSLSEDEVFSTSDSDDEDDNISPKSSFQARLEWLRKKSRDEKQRRISIDEDDDELYEEQMLWAEAEEDLFGDLEELLDENDSILKAPTRKERNKLFKAVLNGQFEDDYEDDDALDYANMKPATKRKNKGKDLPTDLGALWELDRQKKAERRRERDLQKLINACDPLSKKKGGKKGRKAMLRAAKYEPTINVLPNRVIDTTTLVQQIRRFVADLGGPVDMQLPPADNSTRKTIHEVARVFNLKSKSKGKGESRYTTLTKTSRTGEGRVDERELDRVCRRFGRGSWISSGGSYDKYKGSGGGGGGGGGGRGNFVPKHKEGDEVGATAPKIGQNNKGFKMLAMMGWTEGDRIGLSGGLENPLVAIIKHSKLGLGATK